MTDVDTLIAVKKFRAARLRCTYLISTFPLDDEDRAVITGRQQAIDQGLREANEGLQQADRKAHDLLLANDLESALEVLRDARDLAWEINDDRALKWERMISVTESRFQAAIAEGLMASRAQEAEAAAKVDKAKAAAAAKKRKANGAAVAAAATATPAPAPDPKEQQVKELLREAKGAVERNSYYNAIETYEQILKLAPNQAEAAAALRALTPKRSELVAEYLSKANQFFLRQDLDSAVPFFKKVLVLDPAQKRALEGLKMWENLEKIRTGRKK
jgi:tetratricopeptide (TPR) repeat protein